MRIDHVEIKNFRKLKSVRIDFGEKQTVLVGANNSGKTSAMIAMRHFLIDPKKISINDFTLSHWSRINAIGARWNVITADGVSPEPRADEWSELLPSLDVWLSVEGNEVHRVRHLIPTLDWSGGRLGVRLRFEPEDLQKLQHDFLTAFQAAEAAKAVARPLFDGSPAKLSLWPGCLQEFLDRKIRNYFKVCWYVLDPAQSKQPVHGVAQPQPLASDAVSLEQDPFKGLILIHGVTAHRGMEDAWGVSTAQDDEHVPVTGDRRKLSEQLRSYYRRHLDPQDVPDPTDIDALQAIEDAQSAFDERLEAGFANAFKELEQLNYPGVAEPKLKISTRVRPLDGLSHHSAVRYEVMCKTDDQGEQSTLRLPEDYNGLGFQNLISMVFRLMSFRDAWLRVEKASRAETGKEKDAPFPPLHLVLVEEPEAHLHVQVQQVFVRKAYEILRNHPDLGENRTLCTQLVVSTHSSHVVHECEFESLRYFRRVQPTLTGEVPTVCVINLSEVFGPKDETAKFVTRYLRSTHCELFFADGAIFVEGPAERILIPHFIKRWYPDLNHRFITLLEVGGSHAHRFRTLLEHLGLLTLIVTDLDSVNDDDAAVPPRRDAGQRSGNSTLRLWHPQRSTVDELLAVTSEDKILAYADGLSSVRVVYQLPTSIDLAGTGTQVECLATTFEDALILRNLSKFKGLDEPGMIRKIRKTISDATDANALVDGLFDAIRKGEKAQFALDLLWIDKPEPLTESLQPPAYIAEGLQWLDTLLKPHGIVIPAAAEEVAE